MSHEELKATEEARLKIAEAATGHIFADRSLLRWALTHPSTKEDLPRGDAARAAMAQTASAAAESSETDYERLEFLGDAVISLVVTEELFSRFPDLREGDLSKLKTVAVSGQSLSAAALELGLADALFLGDSVKGAGGRGLSSALENGFEALVAALYLDAGFETARAFVSRALGAHIGEEAAVLGHPKSELQEHLQARGIAPHYELCFVEGPPHDRTFTCLVEVDGEELGRGVGRSKKEAEMKAAEAALVRLEARGEKS